MKLVFFVSLCFGHRLKCSQITNTVEELLYNEETYIRSLNYGINGYMKNFNRKGMPASLRGQMYRIFGNVHRIKDFHENIFFPALRQCNMDIVKICNTFCDYIEVRSFFCYFLHALILRFICGFFFISATISTFTFRMRSIARNRKSCASRRVHTLSAFKMKSAISWV